MSIAEGDQLANERSQDYRLRFAVTLPRTAETRVDFSLGSRARRVLIARCRPRRKPPQKTPLANPCNPTPHWPQWSAKTHSQDRTDQKALGVHPQTRAPGSQDSRRDRDDREIAEIFVGAHALDANVAMPQQEVGRIENRLEEE